MASSYFLEVTSFIIKKYQGYARKSREFKDFKVPDQFGFEHAGFVSLMNMLSSNGFCGSEI